MITYEIIKTEFLEVIKKIYSSGQVSFIPIDLENGDYQQYLLYKTWVKEDKKPEDFWKQSTLPPNMKEGK
jgi:hypothetical protein